MSPTLRKLAWPFAVAAAVSAGWAFAPAVPCSPDAWLSAAQLSAASRGDWWPFFSKHLSTAGLPQGADWNDFLVGEDWLVFLLGQLARFLGAWRTLVFAHWAGCVFAGISLFLVARRLHVPRYTAALGGVIFGLSPFAFAVAPGRPGLGLIGILPWVALASLWLASAGTMRRKRLVASTLIVVAAAWSHVELALFSAELVAIAVIVHANRTRWMPTLVPRLGLVAVMGLSFVAVNADTFLRPGPNPSVAAPLPEHFALKVSGLFVGGDQHRSEAMRKITANARAQVLVPEETGTSYLGVAALGLLVFLGVRLMFSLARRRFDAAVPAGFVVASLIVAHAPGGAFSALRLLGFVLPVRLAHVSVVLQLLLLLFGLWAVRRFRGVIAMSACAVVALVAAWDQIPTADAAAAAGCRDTVEADRALLKTAPGELFVLPVVELDPNPGGEGRELLRAYVASRVGVSHGGVRGRGGMPWQQRVGALAPPAMADELRRAGFKAVWVSLQHPNGQAWVDGLVSAGAKVAGTSTRNDSVVLVL